MLFKTLGRNEEKVYENVNLRMLVLMRAILANQMKVSIVSFALQDEKLRYKPTSEKQCHFLYSLIPSPTHFS